MSNIHGDLIKNATDMQAQLLGFSHQLSNLSLKSLDDQKAFAMKTPPAFTPSATGGTDVGATIKANTYISVTDGTDTSYHQVGPADISSSTNSDGKMVYDLSSITTLAGHKNIDAVSAENIKLNPTPVTTVTFTLDETSITVTIPSTGVPSKADGGSPEKQKVAKAMAVVAMNLRGVGVEEADIQEIFKNGITPTSLAAVESQLKGHHDAVLQLSLESLSRVTNILQKIAQKLGS